MGEKNMPRQIDRYIDNMGVYKDHISRKNEKETLVVCWMTEYNDILLKKLFLRCLYAF